MKTYQYAFATFLFLLGSCSRGDKKTEQNNDSLSRDTLLHVADDHSKTLDTADIAFFKKAAVSGMTEVEAASRMLIASQDSSVKQFARNMAADHGKLNQKLTDLARTKGVHLPEELPSSQIEVIKKIDAFKNDGRNEYYAHLMVTDHEKAIDLFNRASASKDAEIATFAKNNLPILDHHFKMARDLESKITAHKRNQGDDPLKLSDKKTMKH